MGLEIILDVLPLPNLAVAGSTPAGVTKKINSLPSLSSFRRGLQEPSRAPLGDQALRLPAYVELGGSVRVEHPLEKKERRPGLPALKVVCSGVRTAVGAEEPCLRRELTGGYRCLLYTSDAADE